MTLQLSQIISLCSVFKWFGINVAERHLVDLQVSADVEPTVDAYPFQISVSSGTIHTLKLPSLNNTGEFFFSSIRSILMPFVGKWHWRSIVISYISAETSTFLSLLRFSIILNFISTVQFCFHFCAITRFLGKLNASNFKLSVLCNSVN